MLYIYRYIFLSCFNKKQNGIENGRHNQKGYTPNTTYMHLRSSRNRKKCF